MTNRLLQEQGFQSVKELWVKIHYPGQGPVNSVNRPVRTRMRGGGGWGGELPGYPLRCPSESGEQKIKCGNDLVTLIF